MIESSMLSDFINEALEHLEELENSLLRLEEHKEDPDVLDDIFRSMHTIKGAAQFVGIERVSELSHKLENLLDLIRQEEQELDEESIDLLIAGKDRISLLVTELEQSQEEKSEIEDLILRIQRIAENSGEIAAPAGEGALTDNSPESIDVKETNSSLEDDIVGEEQDEELFAIFLQQLREDLPFLQAQVNELPGSKDKLSGLGRCGEVVGRLKSSANYMGYDKFTHHYSEWQQKIDAAEEQSGNGEDPDLAFMQIFIDEIIKVYPEAMAGTGDDGESGAVTDALEALFSEDSSDEKGGEDLDSLLDSVLNDTFNQPLDEDVPENAVLENETAGEEYDEELLDIFLQQLQQNIPLLQKQINEFPLSENKAELLQHCRNDLKRLQSSANYMGYEKLNLHYLRWSEDIEDAAAELSQGQEPDCVFMQAHLDAVVRAYPQAITDAGSDADNEEVSDALDTLFQDGGIADKDGDLESEFQVGKGDDDLVPAQESAPEVSSPGSHGDGEGEGQFEELENETLEEEYDKELLGIFMQQLNEGIPLLHAEIARLSSSTDQQGILNRCHDAITTLQSSANYMGYAKLANHYAGWQDEIEAAEAELDKDSAPDLAFMQYRLDQVIKVYPGAMESGQDKVIPPKAEPVPEPVVMDDDEEFEDITDTIGSMLSGPSVSEKFPENHIPSPMEDAGAAADIEEGSLQQPDSAENDKELFNRLSSALDASLEQQGNTPLKPMHGVIEEMIAPSSEETAEEKVSGQTPPAVAAEQVRDRAVIEGSAGNQEKERRQEEPHQEEKRQKERRSKKDAPAKIKQSMRVDTDKIDFLMNQVGELVVSRAYFAQLFAEMKGLQQHLHENFSLTKSELKPLNEFAFRLGEAGVALGRVSNELQEGVMKVRMLPIDQLFKRFPRLVRDLVHKTDKKVKLETRGEETELDKMVVEEISDPLIHILRNAVDHGIESVEERKALGKPESGKIILEAYHESDHIVIDVIDDGRGLDIERIKAKALDRGIHSREELNRMSELEVKHLVMQPGFSTAEKATKTSGRGVGMDVVRKNIEKLNGSVEIDTKAGEGSRIRIKIPLTMAIIQALMVRVGGEKFTIPLTTVEETLRIFQRDISEIEGVDVIHLRDTTMPIFKLSRVFGIDDAARDNEKLFVVVVSTGLSELGLVVDELLGQEEVVIKPLADYLRTESGFSGATILGTGGISLILDIPELVKMTTDNQIIKQKKLSHRRQLSDGDELGQQIQEIH